MCVLAALPLTAAIFPAQVGPYTKAAATTISVVDKELYDEFGLEETEAADFAIADSADKKAGKKAAAKKGFTATAWRLRDSTGALALFQFRRPSGAARADFAALAVRTSDGMIFAHGNYVIQVTGQLPQPNELTLLYGKLPRFENSPLPALSGYLPTAGLIANSERYILGPVSLSRFVTGVPPSTAAFRLGSEAQAGQYQTPKGPLTLAIFNYPTPNMARDQATEFQKIQGAAVKRTGPLIALILSAPDADAAERILGKVNYQASVTLNESPPQDVIKGAGNMLMAIFALAGIILCLCIVGGIGFGGFRLFRRKFMRKGDPGAMILLDLDR